jgi:DNA (cytosine-5)-methyltransferase 1
MKKEIIVIDFFAGAGGLSEGLKQAGLKIQLANEANKDAANTYSHNHPKTKIIVDDIRNVKSTEITKYLGRNPDIVIGGPPCQGFSMAGKRNKKDPRNKMIIEFVKKIKELKPKMFLIENVVGIVSFDNGSILSYIEKQLSKEGYHISKRIFNASDFGVPQNRKRLFVLGSIKKETDIKKMKIKKSRKNSISDAISDLDFIDNNRPIIKYKKMARTSYQKRMRINSKKLYNHKASDHRKSTIYRFSLIRPGQGLKDIPITKRTKKRVLVRLHKSRQSPTITTIPDDYIHYSKNRTLTVRECARIQSFPDKYIFSGPRTTGGKQRKVQCPQYTQVGNAVPPMMAKGIGKWIIKQF